MANVTEVVIGPYRAPSLGYNAPCSYSDTLRITDQIQQHMKFDFFGRETATQSSADIAHVVIAGWAGRDKTALENHIAELERAGIPRPKTTPAFYRVGNNLLTQALEIQVSSTSSSGEVEAIIFDATDGLWVGLGSDHTDRKLEAVSVPLSKQVCPKPIARCLWPFADVEGHWDDLELRSYRFDDGERSLYQEGSLAVNMHPTELIELYEQRGNVFHTGTIMFCGTLAAKSEISFSERFEMEIYDPVLERRISHAYDITALPG